MADNNNKPGGKIGETLLGVLGALGSIAGPLITGRDIDFGMPFKLGSAYLQNERMNSDLMKALNSNPETAGIVEGVQGIMGQGGLPGILNNISGGVQQPVQQPDLSQMGNMGIGMTSGGMPTAPIAQSPLDVQSPDFLRQLTKFRPDIAEKVITSQASMKPMGPLDDIMKLLALQSFRSPEQKEEAGYRKMDYLNQLMSERQSAQKQEAAQLGREKWSVGEQEFLRNADFAVNNSRLMLDKLNVGIEPTVLTAVIGKSPAISRIAMTLDPQLADQVQEYRDILKTVMTAVKTQSGVQYGFRELQWIKSSQPNEWDTPEMFKRGITQAMNTQLWNKYGVIIKKAERAGNAEVALREGMTPEQIKAWKVLDAQLAKRATTPKGELGIFTDPNNAPILQALGMGMLPPIQSK